MFLSGRTGSCQAARLPNSFQSTGVRTQTSRLPCLFQVTKGAKSPKLRGGSSNVFSGCCRAYRVVLTRLACDLLCSSPTLQLVRPEYPAQWPRTHSRPHPGLHRAPWPSHPFVRNFACPPNPSAPSSPCPGQRRQCREEKGAIIIPRPTASMGSSTSRRQ
jgi:hypothetical protein